MFLIYNKLLMIKLMCVLTHIKLLISKHTYVFDYRDSLNIKQTCVLVQRVSVMLNRMYVL